MWHRFTQNSVKRVHMSDEISKMLEGMKKLSLDNTLEPLKISLEHQEGLAKMLEDVSTNHLAKQLEDSSTNYLAKHMEALGSFKNPLEGLDLDFLKGVSVPYIESPNYNMPNFPKIKSIWETQAEIFMGGLREQAESLEQSLKPDEELVMTCWHGHEKLQVLSVSMPSHNVVALRCINADGNHVQITGHMNSINFSFMVVNTTPPAKRNKIGFSMPETP